MTYAGASLRRARLSGLLGRRGPVVRSEGPLLPGRLTLRLEQRLAGRRLLVATGTGLVATSGGAAVRLKATSRGRRALRRARRARLVFRAEHRGADGTRTVRSLTVRVRR